MQIIYHLWQLIASPCGELVERAHCGESLRVLSLLVCRMVDQARKDPSMLVPSFMNALPLNLKKLSPYFFCTS